jgi:hypothetical protein
MTSSLTELSINRVNTANFINLDPTSIALKTRVEQFVAGTRKRTDGPTRSPQLFKVIWGTVGAGFVPIIGGGETRRFDFILVGNWDAIVDIGDYWVVGKQQNEIGYIYPWNGYEVKCGGYSHGGDPVA